MISAHTESEKASSLCGLIEGELIELSVCKRVPLVFMYTVKQSHRGGSADHYKTPVCFTLCYM